MNGVQHPLPVACISQSNGLNDPFTGGLSSYGLVLMVAFSLLRRDHFPHSTAGPNFDPGLIQESHPDESLNPGGSPNVDVISEGQQSDEQRDAVQAHPALPYPRYQSEEEKEPGEDNGFTARPPSPGQTDSASDPPSPPKSETHETPTKKILTPWVGRQRGFWHRSSLVEEGSGERDIFSSGSRSKSSGQVGTQTLGRGRPNASSWDRCSNGVGIGVARNALV